MLNPSQKPLDTRNDRLLGHIRAFRGLPEPVLVRLAASSMQMETRNGAEIFTHGDAADAVYAIVGGEGYVRIVVVDRRSKKLMVEVFGVGDIFGEIGVIDPGARTATAVADGRIRLVRIPGISFMAALDEVPALGAAVSLMLARRLRRTFALFQDATFETLEVRLARQLVYLASLQPHASGKQGITLSGRLRQPDLADLLGATTRSIITILNAWRAEGIVLYDAEQARLTINDVALLRALSQAP